MREREREITLASFSPLPLRSDPSLAKVVLFTEKTTTTTLYKGLSIEFKGQLVLLEARKSDKELGNGERDLEREIGIEIWRERERARAAGGAEERQGGRSGEKRLMGRERERERE